MRDGYPQAIWDVAKSEAVRILRDRATHPAHPTITYSQLAAGIASIHFAPERYAFHEMLGEISVEEHARNRGMLSALVVYKGDGRPGSGFYELARSLGHEMPENEAEKASFWIAEMQRVIVAQAVR